MLFRSQTYRLSVEGLPGVAIASEPTVEVRPTEVRSVAVRVQVPPGAAEPGSHPIHFDIEATGNATLRVREKSVFLVPR